MADLITLDNYKLLEGINSTQFDEKFETLITSVSKLVRTYCNSEFDTYASSPGYTEYFDIQWVYQFWVYDAVDILLQSYI